MDLGYSGIIIIAGYCKRLSGNNVIRWNQHIKNVFPGKIGFVSVKDCSMMM